MLLTEAAEDAPSQAWAYIAAESSEATANRWLSKIQTTFDTLRNFPEVGPLRENLARGLRVAIQGNYVIGYVVIDAKVIVVRVLNSARDIAAIAERVASAPEMGSASPKFTR